jgi:hypothetical protein
MRYGRIALVTLSGAPAPHDELDRVVRESLAELDGRNDLATADPDLLRAFDAMAGSRVLDIHARRMREQGRGYYTIGSAGHESNAFVAAALRPSSPARYRPAGPSTTVCARSCSACWPAPTTPRRAVGTRCSGTRRLP